MEQVLRLFSGKSRSLPVRYAITTILVAVCFLVVIGLQAPAGLLGFYALFPAIFLSSVLLGRGPGIYASLLGTALLYVLIKPTDSFILPGEFILPLLIFVLVALGLALVSEGLRSAWERAETAERAKDLLLQELGHRIKNNLAMAISVLSLQARLKTNAEAKTALEKAVLRIQAIASAHEHFHPGKGDGQVEMRNYLETLCNHLGDTLRERSPIVVKVEADQISLNPEQAVPIGLIVNELVTNALKHAFPDDRSGVVTVALRRASPLTLTVEDDGIGCPAAKNEHLGSRLTRLLAQQLAATITWEARERGCKVTVVMSDR